MLPKQVETPRGHYLQSIVEKESASNLAGWPMLAKSDYALVGGLIVLYSYIDFNLRRVVEVFHHAGLLKEPWAKKVDTLNAEQVAEAIQSLTCWDDEGRRALGQIEELRGLRNLVAHFAIRRFPTDDAFIFVAKSARDYKRHFKAEPPPGAVFSAVVDCEQIRAALRHVEHVQNWLAIATPKLEEALSPRASANAGKRS
jgi:hypothetical protein